MSPFVFWPLAITAGLFFGWFLVFLGDRRRGNDETRWLGTILVGIGAILASLIAWCTSGFIWWLGGVA
ncbi:DUF4175 domain-containing protein [Actomonas aquatica]|uniref:DUF4175 domain-containing protein n=1 Tax=Actomonas aquatica TaxID=2866162 RepID=A0ABZ1CFQ2_9BACT|nr:DUF4175 domain-containing protein [Opitutus sp. WL0086]WRQ89394.1 DUF4175 domain-containing protein [Opitutus sp. WL0086]